MEVVIFKDSTQASLAAANLIARTILERSGTGVLGFATGETPLQTYAALAALNTSKKISFSSVVAFNLDEYVGVNAKSPNSYKSYMEKYLFSQTDFRAENCHIPCGTAADLVAECAAYESKIKNLGGIDLQLLGLGHEAHLGFNEPSSSLSSRTRLKTLTSRTREANAKHFASVDQVPRHVLTMGLGTIMDARHCVLLAFGSEKADAVEKMVEGPLTASVPASILQMHAHCTVILDEAAAEKLSRQEYYREVFSGKPVWQRWDLPLD